MLPSAEMVNAPVLQALHLTTVAHVISMVQIQIPIPVENVSSTTKMVKNANVRILYNMASSNDIILHANIQILDLLSGKAPQLCRGYRLGFPCLFLHNYGIIPIHVAFMWKT